MLGSRHNPLTIFALSVTHASTIVVVKTICVLWAMSEFSHPLLVSKSLLAQHILEVTGLLFYWADPLKLLFVCTFCRRSICLINLPCSYLHALRFKGMLHLLRLLTEASLPDLKNRSCWFLLAIISDFWSRLNQYFLDSSNVSSVFLVYGSCFMSPGSFF